MCVCVGIYFAKFFHCPVILASLAHEFNSNRLKDGQEGQRTQTVLGDCFTVGDLGVSLVMEYI